jgi:hypothetical protein
LNLNVLKSGLNRPPFAQVLVALTMQYAITYTVASMCLLDLFELLAFLQEAGTDLSGTYDCGDNDG